VVGCNIESRPPQVSRTPLDGANYMFATLATAVIIASAVTAVFRFIVTAVPLGWSPEHGDPVSEAIGFWMMSSVAFTFLLSPILAAISWAGIRVNRGIVSALCAVSLPLLMLAFLSRGDGMLSGLILNVGHWFERPSFFVKEYLPITLGGAAFGYVAAAVLKQPAVKSPV
jgi:hypothetical protein